MKLLAPQQPGWGGLVGPGGPAVVGPGDGPEPSSTSLQTRSEHVFLTCRIDIFIYLKLENLTELPSMLQSPPQPVMPSSQPMSIPPPPHREPDQTWAHDMT